jgi:GntR family transcriptional regulator, rspAB operon transcriptional repressor
MHDKDTSRPLPEPAKEEKKPLRRHNSVRVSRMAGKADMTSLENALRPLPVDPTRSCSDLVLEVLREVIIRARLSPGTPLSEVAIANVLGVSRTPVREALRHLAQEDLVRVYPQAATVVSPLNEHFLNQGRFIRRSLECANVVSLAVEISTRDLRTLHEIIKAQGRAINVGPPGDFFQLDELMHQTLFEIADRSLAWTHIQQVKQHFDRVRWLLNRDPKHSERAYREHVAIFERLKAGDGAGASAVMYDHISAITQDMVQLRKTMPSAFSEG